MPLWLPLPITNLGEVRGVLVDEAAEHEVGLDGDAAPRHARLRGREAVGRVGRVARAHQEVVEERVHVTGRLVGAGQVQVGRVVLDVDRIRIGREQLMRRCVVHNHNGGGSMKLISFIESWVTNLPICPDALDVANLGLRAQRGVADVLKGGSVLRDDRFDGLL